MAVAGGSKAVAGVYSGAAGGLTGRRGGLECEWVAPSRFDAVAKWAKWASFPERDWA